MILHLENVMTIRNNWLDINFVCIIKLISYMRNASYYTGPVVFLSDLSEISDLHCSRKMRKKCAVLSLDW